MGDMSVGAEAALVFESAPAIGRIDDRLLIQAGPRYTAGETPRQITSELGIVRERLSTALWATGAPQPAHRPCLPEIESKSFGTMGPANPWQRWAPTSAGASEPSAHGFSRQA